MAALTSIAGLLISRKRGREVYNLLADDSPALRRDHCVRQLDALIHTTDDDSTEAGRQDR